MNRKGGAPGLLRPERVGHPRFSSEPARPGNRNSLVSCNIRDVRTQERNSLGTRHRVLWPQEKRGSTLGEMGEGVGHARPCSKRVYGRGVKCQRLKARLVQAKIDFEVELDGNVFAV